MKPRQLELRAFGPFGGTVRVDFDALAHRSLFLVHGATGAGKTTLLDAMAFALYGVTSGGDRSAKEMRSHHAPPGKATEVTFTFDVRGRTYRVWRMPEQQRPRARGKGTTTTKSQVSLSVLGRPTADEDAPLRADQGSLDLGLEQWTELADKAGDVEARVTDLIGLSADQFRQVVLLPQGRFREFLLSSSRERQAILESLFGTERFSQIEEALKAEVERLKVAIRAQADRRHLLLEQAGIDSDVDPLLMRARHLERLEQLSGELEAKAAAADGARRAAEAARTLRRAQAEASSAQAALEALEAKADEQRVEADRLALARRAQEATRAWERHQALVLRVEALAKRQHDAEAALGQARTRRDEAEEAVKTQRAQSDAVERAYQRRRELEGLAARFAAFQQALADAEGHAEAAEQARQAVANAERSAADANAAHANAADELDEARLIADQQANRQALYLRLLGARKTWLRRQEVRERDAQLRERLKQLIDEAAEANDRLAAAELARDAAESAWLRGQAAELARALGDGDACPVCGSTDHPAPADGHAGADDAGHRRMKSARSDADAARSRVMQLGSEAHQVEAERQTVATELGLLDDSLEEWVDAERDALEREVDRAAQAIEQAEEAAARIEVLHAQMQQAATTMKAATERTVTCRRALEQVRALVEQSGAIIAERKRGLPEALQEEGALDRALKAAQEELAALEHARTAAEAQRAEADRQLATAEEAFRQAKAAQAEAETERDGLRQALDDALAKAGLDDEALADAQLPDDEREAREQALAAWETSLASARDRTQRALGQVAALTEELGELSPLQDAEARADAAAQAHRDAVAEQARIAAQLEQLDRALEGVRSTEDETLALEERYGVIGRVAEVALGDNRHRMTLQRFVLATLLDEVLQTASERLSQMSNGRFLLRRSVATRPSRRRALGLELSVFDHHTGTERPAATLSGGESFLAALALALGLADAVQARAGGRPLEAIFIDEGFGGLDPESLDLALSALSRLTDSGRQVGIISHVAELRERIDARLHVTGGQRGSRVEIRTP
jgi:exonuclease SbcC